MSKTMKTDAEWRVALSSEQYRVLRKKGTERPFTGEYYEHPARDEGDPDAPRHRRDWPRRQRTYRPTDRRRGRDR